jgi:DNA primase
MAGHLDRLTIDEIKAAFDLRAEWPWYSGKQKVSRAGYVVDRCPFHDDHNPSFIVYPDSARCFAGCPEVYDIISVVMKLQNVDFFQAVMYLADRRGMRLNLSDDSSPRVQLSINDLRAAPSIPAKLTVAALRNLRRLREGEEPALRCISQATLDRFDIRRITAGVMAFPVIEDNTLENVRIYAPGNVPKWRPWDTDRGKQLYGSDGVTGGRVIIVEGEKDVLAAWELGIRAVAPMGSASLTREMVRRLDMADEIFVLGDNDLAGMKMNASVCKMLRRVQPLWWSMLKPGHTPPPRYDVADFLQEGGTLRDFEGMIERSRRGQWCEWGRPKTEADL